MENRLKLAKELMREDGNFFGHIDNNEDDNFKKILNSELIFIEKITFFNGDMMTLWWLNSNKFFEQIDYIYHYGKTEKYFFRKLFKVKKKYLYGLKDGNIENKYIEYFKNNLLNKDYINFFDDTIFPAYNIDLIWEIKKENKKIYIDKLYIEI